MDFGRTLGWLALNVLVPIFAPMALLLLLVFTKRYRDRKAEVLRESISEGQLFWTIIAMCAAALYEAAVRIGELWKAGDVGGGVSVGWTAILWHGLIICISAVLVLFRTQEIDEERERQARKALLNQKHRGRMKQMQAVRTTQDEEPEELDELETPDNESPQSGSTPYIVTWSIRLTGVTALTFSATHLWAVWSA